MRHLRLREDVEPVCFYVRCVSSGLFQWHRWVRPAFSAELLLPLCVGAGVWWVCGIMYHLH